MKKIEGKFYPLTPELGEKLRNSKLTAAEWRLWSYLVEIDSWGDKYQDLPTTLEIMQKVDIKKSTFYAAIAKFQELELFDFQDKGFSVRNLQCPKKQKPVQDSGSDSEKLETIPKTRKVVRKNGNFSEISEKQKPEPLENKDFIASQTNQTYSDYLKTLSDSERDGFEKFCKRKIKESEFEIKHVTAWLNKYYLEYWEDFKSRYPDQIESVQPADIERPPLKYLKAFHQQNLKNFSEAARHHGYSHEEINQFLEDLQQ